MEKGIKKSIKVIVEQIMKEVVEKINMEEDIRNPPKLRRSSRDRKQIRKFLAYYRDLREMKDKRSEYKEEHRVYNLGSSSKSPTTSGLT
jgi:hypothetical protein